MSGKGDIVRYQEVLKMFEANRDKPLEVLRRLGGYYNSPQNDIGQPIGPLVGYAGKYEPGKNYVGFAYANWAKAEPYPFILQEFAQLLGDDLETRANMPEAYCGAPMGGIVFARDLATINGGRSIFAEKDVTKAKDPAASQREESKMVLGRHEIIYPGETVAIVEGVANNFSSTDKMIKLIRGAGGKVVAIVCLLNRSLNVESEYLLEGESDPIPVISLVRQAIPEYRQDDSAVVEMIAAGNVIWEPKKHWDLLMAAMEKAA